MFLNKLGGFVLLIIDFLHIFLYDFLLLLRHHGTHFANSFLAFR